MQKQLHFPTLGAKFLAIKRQKLKSYNMQQLYFTWIESGPVCVHESNKCFLICFVIF